MARLLVAVLAVLFAVPMGARAAEVSVAGGTVNFRAAPGETNSISVASPDPGQPWKLSFTDTTATITAGGGCQVADTHHATCDATGATLLSVAVLDGDDTVFLPTPVAALADGGPGADTLTGDPYGEPVTGVAVDHQELDGGDGNDVITGGAGNDALDGGNGDDVLIDNRVLFHDSAGNDHLIGGPGIDLAKFGPRHGGVTVTMNDTDNGDTRVALDVENAEGTGNTDDIQGNDLPNRIQVFGRGSTLRGMGGEDVLRGTLLSTLDGGAGDDRLDVTSDGGTLDGGPGNDRLVPAVGTGVHVMSGGSGIDTVDFSTEDSVDVTLDDTANDSSGDNVKADVENVLGGVSNRLIGNNAANELTGGPGPDVIDGSGGEDVLDAAGGDDRLLSRDGGPDEVGCGAGADSVQADLVDALTDCERLDAPQTAIGSRPPDRTSSSEATFEFSSDAATATFACRLDGGEWAPCTAPRTYAGLSDASHAFEVAATDEFGFQDATPASASWIVDTSPPTANVAVSPARVGAGTPVQIDASASTDIAGAIAGFAFDRDGDGSFETENGTDPTTETTFSTGGRFTVGVRVTDAVGLTSTATAPVDVVPPPPSDTPAVSIDAGARFTNSPDVTISVVWPRGATDLLIANDGGFGAAQRIPVAPTVSWKLDASGPERLPKTIYVRFLGGSAGNETYQDDIILDETPPTIRSATFVRRSGTSSGSSATRARKLLYRLRIRARDTISGLARMQITSNRRRPGRAKRFHSLTQTRSSTSRLYVRVSDRAGNRSRWRGVRSTATLGTSLTVAQAALQTPSASSPNGAGRTGQEHTNDVFECGRARTDGPLPLDGGSRCRLPLSATHNDSIAGHTADR